MNELKSKSQETQTNFIKLSEKPSGCKKVFVRFLNSVVDDLPLSLQEITEYLNIPINELYHILCEKAQRYTVSELREIFLSLEDLLEDLKEKSKIDSGGVEKDLFEKLADLEHKRWADWQNYVFENCCEEGEEETLIIHRDYIENWKRQINTSYAHLSEQEKESDRKEVRKYLKVLRDHDAIL